MYYYDVVLLWASQIIGFPGLNAPKHVVGKGYRKQTNTVTVHCAKDWKPLAIVSTVMVSVIVFIIITIL